MSGSSRTVVIGVGNDERGDDAVGLAVARVLARSPPPEVEVAELSGDLTGLLDLWAERPLAVVADAVLGAGPPGTLVRRDVTGGESLPTWGGYSTHGISLAEAVRLGASLDRRPGRLILYGVTIAAPGWGRGLTPAVAHAVPGVAGLIREELARPGADPRGGP